ncbi:MAG: rhomboid family intramembrane serine protease [Saprospirales bacterium]|nr:rhomboid family intramembrane serine protease [Saprospirales bacterium]
MLYKPWQLFTYMFLHEKFWHILWNMVALYWFGNIVGDLIGKSKVIPIYILGGLVGGFFILQYITYCQFLQMT